MLNTPQTIATIITISMGDVFSVEKQELPVLIIACPVNVLPADATILKKTADDIVLGIHVPVAVATTK